MEKGIRLSNGRVLRNVIASGALAFDGKGWPWERWLVWIGWIKPELFAVVLKTLTLPPTAGNFRWWNPLTWLPFSPWSCLRFISGGAVNKVGLTNKGFWWWVYEIAPKIDFEKYPIIVSIKGTTEELVVMAEVSNRFNLVAVEINDSCPNSGHKLEVAESAIRSGKAVKKVSRHPVIIKVGAGQDYAAIAIGLKGIAEAVALNSVPWEVVFPNKKSPLYMLAKKVGGGGGGVSGKPAQKFNWPAVEALAKQGALPVIAPDIMGFADIEKVEKLGASAISYGTIHLPTYPLWRNLWTIFTNPCKPTRFVEMKEENKS